MASTHRITISRIEGEFTKDKDLIGKQDPFVVFEYGDQKSQTKALKNAGLQAAWTEEVVLENLSSGVASSQLRAAVYNHNTLLPDGLIGYGATRVNDGSHTISLVDKKGNDAGVLRFHINGHGLFGREERTSGYETGTAYETGRGTGVGTGVGTGIGAAGVGAGLAGATHGHSTTGVETVGHTTGAHGTTGTRTAGLEERTGVDRATHGVGAMNINERRAERREETDIERREGHKGLGEKAREAKETVKEALGGHRTGTTDTHYGGGFTLNTGATTGATTTTYGAGSALNNYKFSEGALELRGERSEVCDSKMFVVVEDRPIEKEIVHRIVEHIPVEKKYVVETRFAGEVEKSTGRQIENMGARERVVSVAQPTSVCEGAPTLEVDQSAGYREVTSGTTTTTTTGHHHTGHHHTGHHTGATTGVRDVTQDYPVTGAGTGTGTGALGSGTRATGADLGRNNDFAGAGAGLHTGATSGVTAGHPVGSHVPGTAAHEARVVEKEEEGRGGILQGLKDSVSKVTGGRV